MGLDNFHVRKTCDGQDNAVRNVGTTIGTEGTWKHLVDGRALAMRVFAICQRRTLSKLTSLLGNAAIEE